VAARNSSAVARLIIEVNPAGTEVGEEKIHLLPQCLSAWVYLIFGNRGVLACLPGPSKSSILLNSSLIGGASLHAENQRPNAEFAILNYPLRISGGILLKVFASQARR
jgi:hypothetical protein